MLLAAAAAIATGRISAAGVDGCGVRRQRCEHNCCDNQRQNSDLHTISFGFSRKRRHGHPEERPGAMRAERKPVSLNSQIVFELKDSRMIAQTRSKFAQSYAEKRSRPGVRKTLRKQGEADRLRFGLFLFGGCDGRQARRTGFRCGVCRRRATRRVVRLAEWKLCREIFRE